MKSGCTLVVSGVITFKFLQRIKPTYVKIGVTLPHLLVSKKGCSGNVHRPPVTDGERFWAKVKAYHQDNTLTVEVNQDLELTAFHGLKDKDLITIEPKNVITYLQ